MTWKKPFSPAEVEYIRSHQDQWPSELAYKLSILFGEPRTTRGVTEQLKKIKRA